MHVACHGQAVYFTAPKLWFHQQQSVVSNPRHSTSALEKGTNVS